MTILNLLTVCLGLGLVGLAVTLFRHEWAAGDAPPGDRRRRSRRMLGAILMALLGAALPLWDLIEPRREPLLFLNVSAALLVLVVLLLMLGLWDLGAVNAAARHRKLSILTQELYGISLKDMEGREAERAGREALKKLLHERKGGAPVPREGDGKQG